MIATNFSINIKTRLMPSFTLSIHSFIVGCSRIHCWLLTFHGEGKLLQLVKNVMSEPLVHTNSFTLQEPRCWVQPLVHCSWARVGRVAGFHLASTLACSRAFTPASSLRHGRTGKPLQHGRHVVPTRSSTLLHPHNRNSHWRALSDANLDNERDEPPWRDNHGALEVFPE